MNDKERIRRALSGIHASENKRTLVIGLDLGNIIYQKEEITSLLIESKDLLCTECSLRFYGFSLSLLTGSGLFPLPYLLFFFLPKSPMCRLSP